MLDGSAVTLADLHLAPMIDYFLMAPEGAAMMAGYPALSTWWRWIAERDSFRATRPVLGGAA